MGKTLGDKVAPHDLTTGLPDADGTTAVGDAVALDAGDLEPGDANAGHELAGVRPAGAGAGDDVPVTMSGVVIARVESGVTAGSDLDLVDTSVTGAPEAGHLVASSGGPAHALSDEGGTYEGADLAANEAAVYIR